MAEAMDRDRELYARLTAPEHENQSDFREHQRIEGYYEDRDAGEFQQCDRLLRLDTLYGALQLGYHPRKGVSFLFANTKTSVFDNAASRYQKEIREYRMFHRQKQATQNVACAARRAPDSSTAVYLYENRPWSPGSVAPYLQGVSPGTLMKTMPFLEMRDERARLEALREEKKRLSAAREPERRRRDNEVIAEQNLLVCILNRQHTRSQHFFRRVNRAFDVQKHELFAYYRGLRRGGLPSRARAAVPDPGEEDDDE